MKLLSERSLSWISLWMLVLGLCAGPCVAEAADAVTEVVAPPAVPEAEVAVEPAPDDEDWAERRHRRWTGKEIISFRSTARVGEKDIVDRLVSIFGDAKIRGKVLQEAVVIGGDAEIDGKIGHDLVVVLGSATLGPNADVRGDTIVIGGTVKASPEAKMRRGPHEFPLPAYAEVAGWMRNGFLLARPLPPQLAWVWYVAGVLFVVNLLLGAMFPRQAQSCVEALDRSPGGALLAGFLGIALFAPLLVVLAATVVGILLVPFAICAFLGAGIFGKVVIYRFAGQQLGAQVRLESAKLPFLGLLIGTLVFYALYTVPILGMLVWMLATVVGLGAVLVAAGTALRGEPKLKPEASIASAGMAGVTDISPENPGVSPGLGSEFASSSSAAMIYPYAGFWVRTAALLLDVILVGFVSLLLHFPPTIFILLPIYYVAMWTWKGTSIGGIVLGLRLARSDGRPMGFAVSLIRALSGYFSMMVFGLGFLWIAWDHEKQSWHDKIAGTHVVRVPRGVSLV